MAVGGPYNTNTILTIINLNSKETIPVKFWIEDGSSINIHVKQAVYTNEAKIYYNKKHNKYLYVCGSGRYMELFRLDNDQAVNRKAFETILPKYVMKPDELNYIYQRDFKHRGLKTSITDDYIYTKREEYTTDKDFSLQTYKGYSFYFNDIVDVYDWDGNWIKCYQVDMPFCDLLVDPVWNVMYITTHDLDTDESVIRKYQLQDRTK